MFAAICVLMHDAANPRKTAIRITRIIYRRAQCDLAFTDLNTCNNWQPDYRLAAIIPRGGEGYLSKN